MKMQSWGRFTDSLIKHLRHHLQYEYKGKIDVPPTCYEGEQKRIDFLSPAESYMHVQ